MNDSVHRKVTDSIATNWSVLFPKGPQRENAVLELRKQRTVGLNITYSPRYSCALKDSKGNNQSTPIFVKCKHDVQKEYENMQLLWRQHYFKATRYMIPKPIFLDKTNNLLFLEHVSGCSLLNGFYGSGRPKGDKLRVLQSRLSNVAQWLVDFQGIHVSKQAQRVGDQLGEWEPNVQSLLGLSSDDKRRVMDKMRRVIDSFPDYHPTYVTNQFLPRNIMFLDGDHAVCGVDFPKMAEGWPLYDFLTFAVGIEKLDLYPYISRNDCLELKEVFATEYCSKANMVYDRQLMKDLWAAYVILDFRRRYQLSKAIRLKGLGNTIFAYRTARRLAEWSRQ